MNQFRTSNGLNAECGGRIAEFVKSRALPLNIPQSAIQIPHSNHSHFRLGMSLIEVLISMFVLLFGLMGVAAIFPVGNHYVVEGEKFDLGAALAQNAFEELKARGMLKPEHWYYPDLIGNLNSSSESRNTPLEVIQPRQIGGNLNSNQGLFNITGNIGPGHAFVIDPMGAAEGNTNGSQANIDLFPYTYLGNMAIGNPWDTTLAGSRWPVRRVTVQQAGNLLMGTPVAETIFSLRDDLAVEQPDESDQPSRQRWDMLDVNAAGDPNDTPDDQSDDQLLRRQYKGDYSWLATIVPTTEGGVQALQPASEDYGEIDCDVSVVVFRKRETTPSGASERRINAELLVGGELVIYSTNTNNSEAKDEVDGVVEDIRTGNWITLMGVNQTTGDFVMKWYRLLAFDDETSNDIVLQSNGNTVVGRRAMLVGPDWPKPLGNVTHIPNLMAGFFPGAISVVTKPLKMENFSLWDLR